MIWSITVYPSKETKGGFFLRCPSEDGDVSGFLAVAMMASSFERGAQPRRRLAFSLVAFFFLLQLGQELLCRWIFYRDKPHHPIGHLAARHSFGILAHAAFQHLRDFQHRHEIAGNG